MRTLSNEQREQVERALVECNRLRRFSGAPNEFWPAFMAAVGNLVQAHRGLLILPSQDESQGHKKLSDWSSNGHAHRANVAFMRELGELIAATLKAGRAILTLEPGAAAGGHHLALGVALPLSASESCVAAFLVLDRTEDQAEENVRQLQLVSDIPASYRQNLALHQARKDVEKFASVLDLVVQVNSENRFLGAALAFCNGIASQFQFDRASLGWLEKGYVRLKTMSRTERFDRHMAAVETIERAMEEALDQDDEIVWPAPEGAGLITRDHQALAHAFQSGHVCSLPLRFAGKGVAVLTCERQNKPVTPLELQQLRLACDQAVFRLADLKRRDRWFGARAAAALREKLARLLGPEHTWAKVGALAGTAAVVLLLLPIYPYRVEGNFITRSDNVSFLTAPFEGFIREVKVEPGDFVQAGSELLALDTAELELQEAAAIAEQVRFLREAEKARAAADLAEMRIAQAQADYAQAQLSLIRYRLNQARIRAPFDGTLVEGDLRQRIGAPLKEGEPLFRVAALSSLYIEAEINERDVREILDKSSGEIAFVTQPKLKFPVRVERIEPAAFPKEGQNVFLVRCEFTGSPQPWWRPGMSGVCKIDVEPRTLLWILTHRTVDFIRMLIWW